MPRSAVLAMALPMVLAGCALPASRMPPGAATPMMQAPAAAAPAPMAQPAFGQTAMAPQPAFGQPAFGQPAAMPQPAPGSAPWATTTPVVAGLPPSSEPPPPAARGIAGLEERKPDLCGTARHASAIGQPGSVIPTLGITRSYRVVEYRGIEPQDYVPDRMVFRLDAMGNISNIDCG
ncbi:hypothetical protein [Paracoccus sp. (in: a-proteobacteria)]|uniref:hypothetical protein n=1 Tax=Paracoccus sp. TaxID=267 RepID=UPI00272AC102|nr:hypothetical protein [Paracoccus sp. (in: a-proteobacteria)]